jgi:hypothetical protein
MKRNNWEHFQNWKNCKSYGYKRRMPVIQFVNKNLNTCKQLITMYCASATKYKKLMEKLLHRL